MRLPEFEAWIGTPMGVACFHEFCIARPKKAHGEAMVLPDVRLFFESFDEKGYGFVSESRFAAGLATLGGLDRAEALDVFLELKNASGKGPKMNKDSVEFGLTFNDFQFWITTPLGRASAFWQQA